jgi:modulator of FtsH protease HflK
MLPLFFAKSVSILAFMNDKKGWVARAGALLNEGGGPWGGRGGGGSGGDSGGSGGDGGGPRSPWSQPPGGGKPRRPRGPSALGELQRKLKDQFGGGGPVGGGDNLRLIKYGALAAFVLWVVLTSFHRIDPQERGVVTRFGAYSRTLSSGIGMTLPAPIESVKKLNVAEIRVIDIPGASAENFILTGDQNIVDLDYAVRWSIKDPELYLFQLDQADETIREVAESAMRAALSRVPLTGAIGAQRGQIEADVERRMRVILDSYRAGVKVEGVAIKRADPPSAVNEAFKAVTVAQQQAQSMLNNANAYAQQVKQNALGETARFDKVYEQYRLSPEVTRRRLYYETMEKVLAKTDKTIVEASGVTPFLPLPELKRRAAPPAADVVVEGRGQ